MSVLCVLVVLCAAWSGTSGRVSDQTCTKVFQPAVTCEDSGTMKVTTTCPENYIVKVQSADYMVADRPVCPAHADTAHCHVKSDPDGLMKKCQRKSSCSVVVRKDWSGTCPGNGAHYVRMVYNCEPLINKDGKATVTSIAKLEAVGGVQLVFVASDLRVMTQNHVEFTDTSLGCVLTVPRQAQAQVSFQLLYMNKNPAQDGCNQRIQFWDGVRYEKTLCDYHNDVTLTGCDVSENTVYIRYINDDPGVKVGFILSIGVSHQLISGFDIVCGLTVDKMPAVVTQATNPKITPSTTTNSSITGDQMNPNRVKKQDVQSLKLIIILVSVAVSLIIIVLFVGLLIKRFSKNKMTVLVKESPIPESAARQTLSYSRPLYLDGGTNTNFVFSKRRNNQPLGGFSGEEILA